MPMNLNILRRAALLAMLLACLATPTRGDAPTTLRLMSFNIWVGGVQAGQPLSQSAAVMKLADVVGIQEAVRDEIDHSALIAKTLGWHHLHQHRSNAVISRFPIVGSTPGRHGVFVQLPEGPQICVFNLHLAHAPYQPYQLLKIPYEDAPFITTEGEAIEWAHRSRGAQVAEVLAELQEVQARGIPVFVTGDFNEPSHQDWTARAAGAGLHPIKVEYPATQRVVAAGLVDTFRQFHADEVARPGFTWTPLTRRDDPRDHHDRIDFVFADRRFATVVNAQIVGEARPAADLVIAPWPSDHRAVLATLQLPGQIEATPPQSSSE